MEFAEAIGRPRVDGVVIRGRGRREGTPGSLAVTGHHLIFSPAKAEAGSGEDELWLLHRAVDAVSLEHKSSGTSFLTARSKDTSVLVIEFTSAEDAAEVARSLEVLSQLRETSLAYPFFHRPPFTPLEDGWTAFTPEAELARLQCHTDLWRLSTANADFALCPTYPRAVIVPKSVSDEALKASAAFRSGGRFPVLAYYHKETKSALVRCSEPLVGSSGRRCREDEQTLSLLAGSGARGYIIDTRSAGTAQAAKAKGGGWEPEGHYPLWKRLHKALPKASAILESYQRLTEAAADANSSTDKWLSRLKDSAWLANVAELLTTACLIAQSMDREEMSVVVHGGESLDATLALTSLSQLLLDPDARTLRGFCALVEREWVAAGHPFQSRTARGPLAAKVKGDDGSGATFALFTHTVAVLLQQFGFSFEFNERFLLFLTDCAYASDYGTFLGNNEADKERERVKERSTSLWSFVFRPEAMSDFLNPFYEPNPVAIWPSVAPQSVPLWERAVFRWSRDWSHLDEAEMRMGSVKSEEATLQASVTRLRRQIVELERANAAAQQAQPLNAH